MTRRIAVVGGGISGLTAAYLLARRSAVTLFEAEPRLGGHAHTHDIADPDGTAHAIDTGFIVHNDSTYPLLRRLFGELGVRTRPTEMSMSIHCGECALEYAGGRGLRGILARPRGLADPRFIGLLAQVRRFHRLASATLRAQRSHADAGSGDAGSGDAGSGPSYGSFGSWLRARAFGDYFVHHYAIPLVACVWSSGHEAALEYPAAYLFAFLDRHGMLSLSGSPRWYVVDGGSRTYVDAVSAALTDVRLADPVVGIRRGRAVTVSTRTQPAEDFDAVVVATHADTALRLLQDPTPAEVQILGAFGYSDNETLLHTDGSLLPPTPAARSSWNYAMSSCTELATRPEVSYWMDRLQALPGRTTHVVTLNAAERVAADSVLATMTYRHPRFTSASVAAQARLPELATTTTAYAGAYHGWGFHEDGCRSGVRAAEHFGVRW